MNCPLCDVPNVEECAYEVDIGVGVQRTVWGYVCSACGEIPVCYTCGCIGDDHARWCEGIKNINIEE